MHTNHPKEDPLVELGYEHRDVNYRTVLIAIGSFFVFTVFCFGAGYLYYTTKFPANKRMTLQSELSANRVKPAAPNPLLQDNVNAKTDIMTLRKAEYDRLHGTGTIEGSEGKVHIPVDRAMDLLVERGLPKTEAPTQ